MSIGTLRQIEWFDWGARGSMGGLQLWKGLQNGHVLRGAGPLMGQPGGV
jgi:hypothetical protein